MERADIFWSCHPGPDRRYLRRRHLGAAGDDAKAPVVPRQFDDVGMLRRDDPAHRCPLCADRLVLLLKAPPRRRRGFERILQGVVGRPALALLVPVLVDRLVDDDE